MSTPPLDLAAPLGAESLIGERCRFTVWAPRARTVTIELGERNVSSTPLGHGYHQAVVAQAPPGTRYHLRLDGGPKRPDPASRSQPEGVHGPSEIVDPTFDWTDARWGGHPLADYVVYELHVGTFTAAGTFDAVIPHLDRLVDLGITAIELMPVAACPGSRNWGYDGVDLFAVHAGYGGPRGLMRLVDACHARGIAVILDVVYNHLGPEGNYLAEFGPYFTDDCRTPWGPAINFDGPGSDEVRRFFLENASMWLRDYHIDALRLDAVHGIIDRSPRPFLAELAERVVALSRDGFPRYLIAESDANDPRLVRPIERGGMGLDAVWADDFHHAVHALLTGEREGYYADYADRGVLARAVERGFAYAGEYSAFRRRRHGAPADDLPPTAFVVCVQNHDQIGNRPRGERLTELVDFADVALAAGLLLMSPFVPLLFMGEEYGETRPFLYFIDHGDPALVEAVRQGRARELAAFGWIGSPPDPRALQTFERCILDPTARHRAPHDRLERLYRTLIRFRRDPRFRRGRQRPRCVLVDEGQTLITTMGEPASVVGIFNLEPRDRATVLPLSEGRWSVVVDGSDPAFGGKSRMLPTTMDAGRASITMPARWFGVLARDEEA